MFPEPLTPKSFPDQLQLPDYDPFHLVPTSFSTTPRVLLSKKQLQAARANVAASIEWVPAAFAWLQEQVKQSREIPATLPVPADPAQNAQIVRSAEQAALLARLTDDQTAHDFACNCLRLLAGTYQKWSPRPGSRATEHSLGESRFHLGISRTLDLLEAGPLAAGDRELFHAFLRQTLSTADTMPHFNCSNINTWGMAGRLSIGLALGDRGIVHDVLYGCRRHSRWRYGLIHQLQHDFLGDGLHWEGTLGYHFYTLMAVVEMACMLENSGIDLWHASLPSLMQNDGADIHRAYGPRGEKTLKAAFDAPFYRAFPNGDFPLLHDSGLAHFRGISTWGILYNKAFEAYGDEKYAWLLQCMETYPREKRAHPDLPMPLNTHTGHLDFVRISPESPPPGTFDFKADTRISLAGRHQNGSTLFPISGCAVLRGGMTARSVGAFLSWNPHWAGHLAPAALHLDLVANGTRITDGPKSGGYDDPLHLNWVRTTIAHNTVTVDEASMFPYDFETESIWEADTWRGRVSDSELLFFRAEPEFSAVRVINENVYPGIRLDRTVIVKGKRVLDVFRVVGDAPRQHDWALYSPATLVLPNPAPREEGLGDARGYRLLTQVRGQFLPEQRLTLFPGVATPARLELWVSPDTRAVTAACPTPKEGKPELGALEAPPSTTALLLRHRGVQSLFVAFWDFNENSKPVELRVLGAADQDLHIDCGVAGGWRLPWAAPDSTWGVEQESMDRI